MSALLQLPLEPALLEGKTRAELLTYCQQAGLKATAWKRDRMYGALTGAEPAEVKAPKVAVIADQLERREAGADAAKALEERLKRTGRCLSTACRDACGAYEAGGKDAFHWQLCACGHTQWSHAKGEADEAPLPS